MSRPQFRRLVLDRRTKTIIPRFFVSSIVGLALLGCASGHESFYSSNPYAGPQKMAQSNGTTNAKDIVVLASSGNFEADMDALFAEKHLAMIGSSSFNGPMEGPSGAVKQAKKVGATHVLMASKYAYTVSGTTTQTVPQTTTSYTRGNVYAGGGVGSYSGTTTTYGTRTVTSSYAVNRFDQEALFLAPIKPEGLGVLMRPLSTEEKARIGSNKGVYISSVAKGSPAFNADIIPGDILLKVNDKPTYDPETSASWSRGQKNRIVVWRNGKTVTKEVWIPKAAWGS